MSPVATNTDAANTRSWCGTPSTTPRVTNAIKRLSATITTTRNNKPRNSVA